MTAEYFSLASGDFFQDWSDTGLITANDDWSGVPSIVGFLGNYTTSTPTGINPGSLTTPFLSNDVDVIANQTNLNITNGGVAEFHIANPTIALQGSGTADAPHIVLYLNAVGRENVTVSYKVRDIDGSGDNAVQAVALQYRTSATGDWITVEAGSISDATTGPNLASAETLVTATLPAAVNGAPILEVRVITTNAAGNDEWVGIDDIRVTSRESTTKNFGAFAIADAQVVEGDSGSAPINFVITRDGADGAVSVDYSVELNGTADAADFAAGTIFSGTVSFAPGETSKTVTLRVAGDLVGEPNETFSIKLANALGGATIKDDAALGTIVNNDPFAATIMEIQGEGHRSAFAGQTVITQGIVTAVDSNGFYLQDAIGDGNARTSDAIFVFTGSAPRVLAGDRVDVRGRVEEFRPGSDADNLTTTQISQATITTISSGNALPAAVLIGQNGILPPSRTIDDDRFQTFDPENDGIDFWESLEGMRVTIEAPLVVSNTNEFGETFVVASGGAGATGVGARGGIAIAEGDYNPEKIQIDDDSGLFAGFKPDFSQGDRLSNVTGVISYSFENYELLVTEAVTVTEDRTIVAESTTLKGDTDNLSVASYNLENLDPTDSAQKFDLLAKNIVYNLSAPDIIAVQEIQDADGAGRGSNLSGQATADLLISWIKANGGPDYVYVEVAPSVAGSTGGEPGGNIRNGFFYNPDRVTFVEGSARLIEDGAFTGSRRPLVADFNFNGQTISAINVHFTSRLGSDPLWGVTQPPANAGDASRTAQATAVRGYVNEMLAADPKLNIIVAGDFNGFYFENSSKVLEQGSVLTNLHRTLPEEERYTYMFNGNLQAIDNMLVTGGLLSGAKFDAVHINSELPKTVFRATDHDAIVATFFIPEPNDAPENVKIDNAKVAENAPAGTVVGTVSATDADGDTLVYSLVDDAGGKFVIDPATGVVTTTEAFDHEAVSEYELVVRATDPDGAFAEQKLTIAVSDVNEAPAAAAMRSRSTRMEPPTISGRCSSATTAIRMRATSSASAR
jgi:predicted extracellular nuclease